MKCKNHYGLNQLKKETETKKLWIKLNKNDFDSLTEDVYNYDNDEFKTNVDKKIYDLKN